MVQRHTLGSHGYVRLCCRSLCRFPDQIWFLYWTSSENYAGKKHCLRFALALYCSQNRMITCTTWNKALVTDLILLQSIGFMGPCVSLLCLRFAQTPSVAAVLMTIALSLSSFSQAGYFCNIQVLFPSLHALISDHTTSTPEQCSTFWSVTSTHLFSDLTECVFLVYSSRTLLPNTLDPCTVCKFPLLISAVLRLCIWDVFSCVNRDDEWHRDGGRHS